tara:strand:+ start:11113 stop:12321 length:1209 start_codon:yes stop_codon:yes gene_type:complete
VTDKFTVVQNTLTNPENDRMMTMQVAAAPGHVFFCRRVEIPEDVEDSERESYLQLQLEGMSPFPLEHLQFGFCVDKAKRYAYIYSGYRRSFDSTEMSEWSKYEVVIPEFSVGVLAGKGEEGAPLLLVSDSSISYFEFDDVSEIPCYFESFPRNSGGDGSVRLASGDLEVVTERLKDRIGENITRIWYSNTNITIEEKKFKFQATEAGKSIAVQIKREVLWNMDLRDPESVEQAKQEEQRNLLIWRVVLAVAAALALLVFGELFWFVERGYLNLREDWNTEQAPIVERIISQQTTINELLSFQDSDLVPFDMLVAIQPFLTDAVWFTKVETNGTNSLKVFANATSNGQVNQFKARLDRFVKIDNVELENIQSRPGGATFTALIYFKAGSFAIKNVIEKVANNG